MKKALGKGLSSLIPDTYVKEEKGQNEPVAQIFEQTSIPQTAKEQAFQIIAMDKIVPNENQPRRDFAPQPIEELAASIKEKGVLQPVVVSRRADGNYDLVCGERRLRAARLCGLAEIPA